MNPFWQSIFGSKQATVEYCELASDAIISRPGYFFSNIAYMIVGVYILRKAGRFSKSFGIFAILIGLSSALYDTNALFYAQLIDLASMSAFVIFISIINLRNLGIRKWPYLITIALALQSIYMILILVNEGSSGRILFGLLVMSVIITEFLIYRRKPSITMRNFKIAFLLFLFGFFIWSFDASQTFCSPISILNGRAIFHYLTALSIYYLYLHNLQKQNLEANN